MASWRLVLAVPVLLVAVAGRARAGDVPDPRPVLVEMYTSQGCSSCPPADRLLARMSREQPIAGAHVIPLSLHVDYWNRLGWEDPFSSPAFTERQRDHARARGTQRIYTPMAVVDGVQELVGSDEVLLRQLVSEAAREPKLPVTVTVGARTERAGGDGAVTVRVTVGSEPADVAGMPAAVLLALTDEPRPTFVPRGENANSTLQSVGVARSLTVLGDLQSAPASEGRRTLVGTLRLKSGWSLVQPTLVAFVQSRSDRRILGLATTPLG